MLQQTSLLPKGKNISMKRSNSADKPTYKLQDPIAEHKIIKKWPFEDPKPHTSYTHIQVETVWAQHEA